MYLPKFLLITVISAGVLGLDSAHDYGNADLSNHHLKGVWLVTGYVMVASVYEMYCYVRQFSKRNASLGAEGLGKKFSVKDIFMHPRVIYDIFIFLIALAYLIASLLSKSRITVDRRAGLIASNLYALLTIGYVVYEHSYGGEGHGDYGFLPVMLGTLLLLLSLVLATNPGGLMDKVFGKDKVCLYLMWGVWVIGCMLNALVILLGYRSEKRSESFKKEPLVGNVLVLCGVLFAIYSCFLYLSNGRSGTRKVSQTTQDGD